MLIKGEKGFSLIEVILAIALLGIFVTLSSFTLSPLYKEKVISEFLKQLTQDLLYSQSYAMTHGRNVYVYISETRPQYVIKEDGFGKTIIVRSFHEHILIKHRSIHPPIVFSSNGNINQSGRIIVDYDKDQYQITFYLGKGRFYVEKL